MKRISLVIVIILILLTTTAQAHGGRTDSQGGHKDSNNVSGLGEYHYHCDGDEAHLHPNGICPYKDENSDEMDEDIENKLLEQTEAKKTITIRPLVILAWMVLVVSLIKLIIIIGNKFRNKE